MAKNIFITATNTEVGKTYATQLLIKEFSKQGYKVGVFKPIETGVKKIPLDGMKLLNIAQKYNSKLKKFTVDDIVPIQYELPAAPFIAKGKNKIDFKAIKKAYKKIAKVSDIVLIEGAGGLLVPVTKKFFMVDFIKYFDATPLLITPSKLGCINDTLLSLNLLEKNSKKLLWCVNLHQNLEKFRKISLPFYEKRFKKIYYLEEDIEIIAKDLLIKSGNIIDLI